MGELTGRNRKKEKGKKKRDNKTFKTPCCPGILACHVCKIRKELKQKSWRARRTRETDNAGKTGLEWHAAGATRKRSSVMRRLELLVLDAGLHGRNAC